MFRFQITERPKQLRAYLKNQAARSRPPANSAQALVAFEAAFGPVNIVEEGWQAFLKRFSLVKAGQ